MSFGVILATHAQIGCALLEGAEMLAGKQERARALALTENKSVDELAAAYDHVVVLCDIYGGTPFNVTSRAKLSGKQLTAFTGVNLPIVIDLLFSGDLTPDEVRAHVAEQAATSVQEIKVELAAEDEDDLDL